MTTARFTEVSDFPSPSLELVTSKVLIGSSTEAKLMLDRNPR
jgi:hypothetical protein